MNARFSKFSNAILFALLCLVSTAESVAITFYDDPPPVIFEVNTFLQEKVGWVPVVIQEVAWSGLDTNLTWNASLDLITEGGPDTDLDGCSSMDILAGQTGVGQGEISVTSNALIEYEHFGGWLSLNSYFDNYANVKVWILGPPGTHIGKA